MFERPVAVTDLSECFFYHSVDLPTIGEVSGHWDLRKGIEAYLSRTNFTGQRVLEIGTADGYLCFELEKRGAEVIAFDLADGLSYDQLPLPDPALSTLASGMAARLQKIRNAYWLSHRLLGSRAKVIYGHVSRLPDDIGMVDYCFLGNILQHLESPLRAISEAARRARKGVIITEANWVTTVDQKQPVAYLLPAIRGNKPLDQWCYSWWQFTPGAVSAWLDTLGFDVVERYEHKQLYAKTRVQVPHFTIVARRRTD